MTRGFEVTLDDEGMKFWRILDDKGREIYDSRPFVFRTHREARRHARQCLRRLQTAALQGELRFGD